MAAEDRAAQGLSRFAEDSSLLLAAAVRDGTSHSTFGSARFRAFASSDQAGTLAIQQSRDGVSWYTTVSQPVAAGPTAGTVLESIVALAFARAVYTNGATNQGAFELDSVLLAV